MTTAKPAGFEHWDVQDIEDLVAKFELAFHRAPSSYDLKNFRRARSAALRLPLQARRSIATLIARLKVRDDSEMAAAPEHRLAGS